MRTQTLFDRLNILKASLESKTKEELKREAEDEVLDLLILAYIYGNQDANESLNANITPNADKLEQTLYRKFEDKDFAERVREYASEGNVADIMRVAETEMHRDYSAGVYDNAILFDGNVQKKWITMMDNRVRDTHFYLEGVSVPLSDRFYTYDGDSALYPGDFSMTANNANCRCTISVEKL